MNKGKILNSDSDEVDANEKRQLKYQEKKKSGMSIDKNKFLDEKSNDSEKKVKEKFTSLKEDKPKPNNEKNSKEFEKIASEKPQESLIPLVDSSLNQSAITTSHIADRQVDSQSVEKILKWISFIYYRQEKMDKKLDDILEILKSKNFKNSDDEV